MPAERIVDDVAASIYHLCSELHFVGVRLVLAGGPPLEARRPAEGPAPEMWRAEEPRLVTAANEVVVPVGAMGRHGEIILVGRPGARLARERFVAVVAANQLEAAARALDLERDVVQVHEKLAALGKLGALGQLVGGVAHEVRTPLTYAQNSLFMLERALRREHGDAVADSVAPHAREIEDALDRVHAIVLQLRRFSKQDVDTRVEEDMRDLVRDALRLWRATHPGAAGVRERLAPTPPVEVDRGQLQQVVLNLVQNAVEAAGPGGAVTVETAEEGEHALLAVVDDGPGMSGEALSKLFQPFHTTKADGLGLGLSIVRGIVEAHRGSIRFDSVVGRGTRVEVRVPRARGEAATAGRNA